MTDIALLERKLDDAVARLDRTRPFAKAGPAQAVIDLARRLMEAGGLERLDARIAAIDAAGVFAGTDWDVPSALLPNLVGNTLARGTPDQVTVEILSILRMLAIAEGRHRHPGMAPEAARHFLTQVMALNLERVIGATSEAARMGALAAETDALFRLLADRIGLGDILGLLVDEIWRILGQRPVVVAPVRAMIAQLAVAQSSGAAEASAASGADRLISALFGPTQESRDDPGIDAYLGRVAALDDGGRLAEARGFARAMHDTGLVSDYHAGFLRRAVDEGETCLVAPALGLGETGLEALRRFEPLALDLIQASVTVATPQAVMGLALLLDRGILHDPPLTASLRRLLTLPLSGSTQATLAAALGEGASAREHLLAGALCALGQPIGIGQGNNPTCQSARAIALWSLNDPDYLLHLVAEAAFRDRITLWFEGEGIRSDLLPAGMARSFALDTDPVSLVLVPHLDRIYLEMGRRCAPRGGDPHRWVNPELHGWWVAREMCLAVEVGTGHFHDHDGFLGRFWASYHPDLNGGDLIHPQPAGIAVTDPTGTFVGWHAIAIIRAAADREGVMRVYFYNPNNDSGQDWGGGVRVSTAGRGERPGEGSLPFAQFASRLYLFHDVGSDAPGATVPAREIAEARRMAEATWGTGRIAPGRAAEGPPG